jgi:uncharacterized protein (TIGR02646 family)
MRKITKTGPPSELTQWQRRNRGRHYTDIPQKERRAIRQACLDEQKGLCAFCCRSATVDEGHNAHIRSQSRYPQQSLDWSNIVASCTAVEHCGIFQGQNDIPLTPLMPECETELLFYASGRIKACTDRAQKTIDILNLDSLLLRHKRKKALESLVYSLEFHPVDDIPTWDAELIQIFIAACDREIDGVLLPYAPVLANIIHQFLNSKIHPRP